jgi:hypothetical protein
MTHQRMVRVGCQEQKQILIAHKTATIMEAPVAGSLNVCNQHTWEEEAEDE